MQLFLLTMDLRFSSEKVEVNASPALEYLADENWGEVILGWQALARRRRVRVDELVADVMKFWGGVRVGSPSLPSFMKGYEVLVGMPVDFGELAGAGKDGELKLR